MTLCCLTGEFVAICVYIYVSKLKIHSKINYISLFENIPSPSSLFYFYMTYQHFS